MSAPARFAPPIVVNAQDREAYGLPAVARPGTVFQQPDGLALVVDEAGLVTPWPPSGRRSAAWDPHNVRGRK